MAHGLRWIEDESNQDDSYDRNFLRLRVVPLLQQRWPHFAEATARSAALCAEQESLLDELLADDLAHCQTPQGTLQIAPMLAMSDAVARRLSAAGWQGRMRRCLPRRVGEDLAGSGAGARRCFPCLRLGAFEIRRYQSQLWWIKSVAGQSETIVPWQTWLQPLELPAGLGSVQLTAEAIFALRVQMKRSACVSKRQTAAYCRAQRRT